MKVPWYETAPGALAALLEGGLFVDVDLYRFTLAGEVLGVSELLYSAGAIDVAAAGSYWPADQVAFDQAQARAKAHWKVGLDVDTWQVVATPRDVDLATGAAAPDRIGTAPWLAALRAGALDGAEVQVDRAFAPDWSAAVPGQNGRRALAPTGIVTIFYGRVAEGDAGRSQAVITINSHLKLMAGQMPRRLYQAACIHTLFDRGCTLEAADFAVSGTVASVSADGSAVTATLAAPAGSGTYALGRIVMADGASAGFARAVRSWVAGSPASLSLIAPFPLGIAAGDRFAAYPGCDKRYSTCARFANQANFGGEIAIPAPETAF
ncbi:MAG TPA: DUF2163 domain-containing protein [Stellaceae bacterium]|nr:DUF2163 domain-containing protein [Stellaceae bacterium]